MLYVGKVNLYLEALDREVKKENENLSVGIIWCASKDDEVVEFALSRRLSPKIKKKKTVIVYGISKATSNKLKTFANKCIELPMLK